MGTDTTTAWVTWYDGERRDQDEGSTGVREPREPIQPQHEGGAALDLPPTADPPALYMEVVAA